jgi:predicted ATPase
MKPTDLSVVYISKDSGQSVPRTIRVDQDGEFVDNWPDQFFELDFYERCS